MVAVVSGAGMGLERSSAWVLGSRGQLGQASLGRAGDNVYVNAANGNLVIQNTDEVLIGLGPDDVIARTYNSLGTYAGETDNWRASMSRTVAGLTGTVSTAGSTVTRTDWDGSQVVYTWDATRTAYVSMEGSGAYDTLTFSGTTWTWKDGNSRIVELYDDANNGRITRATDLDLNDLVFSYDTTTGNLTRVTTEDGNYTELTYSGGLLTSVVTNYQTASGGAFSTLTRVRYGYDGSSRLSTVTVDLSPTDNDVSTGATYVTTYGYDGTSKRVSSITQTDGSSLQIGYTQVGADHRVSSLIQTVAGSATRTTTISYNTVTRVTTITDPGGQDTQMEYDAAGQLKKITMPPAVAGATAQVIQFTYNTNGDILTVNPGPSNTVTYGYDVNGNVTSERDTLGDVVERVFGSDNQLLIERRYNVAGGTGSGAPSGAMITRFAYDSENHLTYKVTAEGRVTSYGYTTAGLLTSSVEYPANTYDVSALGAADTIADSTFDTWVAAISDKSTTKLTTILYDFRGNLSDFRTHGQVSSAGAGSSTERSRTLYTYDQAGRLLSRSVAGQSVSETFVYDGLGRVVSSTDFNSVSTSIQFIDASTTTVVTLANGLTQTSVYNKAGELISYAEAATGLTTATNAYRYDAFGRLRIATDATGVSTHYLYDFVGRKVAEIGADGSLVEYGYNANDKLIMTVRYNVALTGTQLATLVDTNGEPTAVQLSSLRPTTADSADRWEWRIYDNAQRLIETIDGLGAATIYTYDGASRLVAITSYASNVATSLVNGYKTTPPSAKVTPTANAADRTQRNFYDSDGKLTGTLDAEGYLTQILYDAAGQKVRTIGYATPTTESDRASGTFATLLSGVTASANASDTSNWFVYDGRGFLRATIDGEGNLTRYRYTVLGFIDQEVRGQRLTTSEFASLQTSPLTYLTLPAATSGVQLDTITWTRNNYGQVLTEVRTLTSGSETTTYTYDDQRRLIKVATTGTGVDARTENQRYDARGRLIWSLGGEGSVVLAALVAPSQAQIDDVYANYGTAYAYDAAGRLVSKSEPNGTDGAGLKTLYYYDTDGNLTHTINALGEVVEYRYNVFGQRTDTILYGTRIGTTTLATLTGGLVVTALTNAVTAITNAALDSETQINHNVTGTVSQSTDALGHVTTYAYNLFGELVSRTEPLVSTTTVKTAYAYDRRGQLLSTTVDSVSSGLQLATSVVRDAFGRVTATTDPNGNARSLSYDRSGRIISSTDASAQTTTYSYDGRGNVLTTTDRTGKTTTFAYTAFGRQVTVTSPEGVVTTTTTSAYGQTLTITDGAGRVRTWTYTKDGALKTANDGVGTQTQAYDKAGRLATITDPLGVITTYSYDAASRVLTRVVDQGTGKLNLTTTYAYDPKGQQVTVQDPGGSTTTIEYDKAGQKTAVVVDSGGLALRTVYAYDKAGRVVTVTEGSGTSAARATTYVYDKADRLTQVSTGGTSLYVKTVYTYDDNGNVVAKTASVNASTTHITRYVYDAENRLVHTVDPTGGVTTNTYDNEGRVVDVRGYTNVISSATLATLPLMTIATQVTSNITTAANDHRVSYVYDGEGRLRFTIDATARPTEYVYDGAGNVVRKVAYAGQITAATSYSYATVQSQITTGNLAANSANQTTRAVYDAANRQVYGIDSGGRVTFYQRNAAGDVTNQRQYAALYTDTATPTLAAVQTWATANANTTNDRISRVRYDGAGRAVYEVDALGYVTEYQYSADGQVAAKVRYASAYTVTDTTTTASLKNTIGALPTSARVTTFGYDGAGRLTDITDPEGFQTNMVLDGVGQATQTTAAYGTADASTTQRVYDGAGRVTSETVAYQVTGVAVTTTYTYDGMGRMLTSAVGGSTTTQTYDGMSRVTSETRGSGLATTGYAYDGAGQLLGATDAMGSTTTRTYDAMGRVGVVTTPLSAGVPAVIQNQYDAFGNLTQVTDPRGAVGTFVYDALNRLVQQTDPEGYVTTTTYTMGGEVASVTRAGATTTIGRDKLDRVISTTDAGGFVESYTLNAFGDRATITNKLGGVTTNTYDKRGLLTQESKVITWARASGTAGAATVVNKFEYDGRGNLTKTIEAFGQAEVRTTDYTWDKANRLTAKAGDAVQVISSTTNLSTVSTVTPTETYKYDSRGNLIEAKDAAGGRTHSYYDLLNRKTKEVSPVGTLRHWTYDANGNATAERTFGDAVTLQTTVTATAPNPINSANYRETLYAYDLNNRLTETRVVGLRTGSYGTGYTTQIADVVVTRQYDLAGNVVKQTDGAGNSTHYYYDDLGRVTAQIDPEKYMTFYTLNADGNVTKEERFAGRVTGTISVTANPTTLRPAATAGADRVTDFTYDSNGRRLSETRRGVVAWTVGTTGALTAASTDAVIAYSYNGLGEVTQKLEANSDATDYTYDSFGRLVITREAAFTDYQSTSVRKLTENSYDQLNNLTQTREAKAAAAGGNITYSSTNDHITTFAYGAGGRLDSVTDAAGFVRTYGYDAAGRVLKEQYSRLKSDGTSVTEASAYRYDLAGRTTFQAQAVLTGTTWSFGDQTQVTYNTYGEVTAKGLNSLSQETFDYDAGGRMWRSTAGDGTVKLFLYDGAGRVTLSVGTAGRDNGAETVESIVTLLTNSGAAAIGAYDVAGVTATISVYDKRGQNTSTREPFRQLSVTGGVYTTATITRSRTFNAFGEVKSETDARSYVTDFTYNTMGRLIEKKSPTVSVTGENGVSANARPIETYYYDLSGRLVGVKDANNNTNTRALLAGSGHGGGEASVTADFHADGGVFRTAYDAFGDARTLTNEISKVETRAYDKMGRLTTQTRPSALVENYTYDGLGQRITHWNSFLTSSVKDTTDYDSQGRVVKTVDMGGNTTTYAYAWGGTIATTGLGTFGGWTKTTVNTASKTATDKIDYFGRMVDHIDYGAHNYDYTFNKAGQLITKTSDAGQDISYTYFNTGKLASSVDNAGAVYSYYASNITAEYGYDAAGNRTAERYYSTTYTYDWSGTSTGTVSAWRQKAVVTYDALNRMLSFTDTADSANTVTVTYKYDANSNVRNTHADYSNSSSMPVQDNWYKYDSMNRFVLAKGLLVEGEIVRYKSDVGDGGTTLAHYQGVNISYNAAGQRVQTLTTYHTYYGVLDSETGVTDIYDYDTDRSESYGYNDDGYLIYLNPGSNPDVVYTRDGMNRTTNYVEYYGSYLSYSRDTTYNTKSQVTYEVVKTRQYDGTYSQQNTTYYYNASSGGGAWNGAYQGGVLTHTLTDNKILNSSMVQTSDPNDSQSDYTYVWWDQAMQSGLSYDDDAASSSNTVFTSTLSYDVNGHLTSAYIRDEKARKFTYTVDTNGQVLVRNLRYDANTAKVYNATQYHFDGVVIGEVGGDGEAPVYFDIINQRRFGNTETSWDGGADFDQNYQPINGNEATYNSRFTVRQGDTLQSIAEAVWGDASLWWVLADANGMTGGEELAAGVTLTIPAKVLNSHNNADTFRPYDPNKAIGDIAPRPPKPPAPPKQGGCGGMAQIFIAIIAIVVTVVVAPWATQFVAGMLPASMPAAMATIVAGAAGGAVGAAAGSIASQGVAVATGVQDKFSWGAVGLAALGGAVTGGMAKGGAFSNLGEMGGAAARAMVSNVVTQGVAVATGMQEKFSWASVAVSGVVAGVGSAVSGKLDNYSAFQGAANTAGGMANNVVSGMAGAIAGAGAQSLIDGSDFGDNFMAALPSVISFTVGQAIAGSILEGAASTKAFSGSADGDYFLENAGRKASSGELSLWPETVEAAYISNNDPTLMTAPQVNLSPTTTQVQKGDGLDSIARRLAGPDASASQVRALSMQIASYNGVGNLRSLQPGQELMLPPSDYEADETTQALYAAEDVRYGQERAQAARGAQAGKGAWYDNATWNEYNAFFGGGQSTSSDPNPWKGYDTGLSYRAPARDWTDVGKDLVGAALRPYGELYQTYMVDLPWAGLTALSESPLGDAGLWMSIEQAGPYTAVPGAIGYVGAKGLNWLAKFAPAERVGIEALYEAKYVSAYEQGLAKVEYELATGLIKAPAGQPAHLFKANEIDAFARSELRLFAEQQGHGADIIRINQRLYMDSGKYRIPDVYFPNSGIILDGTLGTKTITTPQIIDFTAANSGAPIGIVRPQAYGGSYWVGGK